MVCAYGGVEVENFQKLQIRYRLPYLSLCIGDGLGVGMVAASWNPLKK